MTTIDETTGLPELPEGQFWRVEKAERNHGGLFVEYRMPPFQLSIYRRFKQTRKVPKEVRWLPGIVWGTRETETIEEQRMNSQSIFIMESEAPPENTEGPRNEPRRNDRLTADAILRTAHRIMEERAERERVRNLIGDYPPKSLS